MEISSHFIRRPDGTRLRAFDTGGTGPTFVLANGLGGPVSAFGRFFQALAPASRVVSWDYRGLYGSTLGAGADISVGAHAADAEAVMDSLGIDSCRYVGWSMGVQVGLEFFRRSPSRVSHLVLMNGTFGRPFRGVPLPISEGMVDRLVRSAGRVHFLGGLVLGGVRQSRIGPRALKALGMIAPSFDDTLFEHMLSDFETIDFRSYMELLGELGSHDAESLLNQVNIPTLVIAGGKDRVTPSYSARRIAERIPRAELFILPQATHYAAVEYPREILERISRFIDKNSIR